MNKLIASFQNPLVKNVLLLEEKPRERRLQNLIVIEGLRETRLALTAGFAISSLLFCREIIRDEDLQSLLSLSVSPFEMAEVTMEVFGRLAYRKDSGGVIALAAPRRILLEEVKLSPNPLLLVLESVEKPGNLGALLRTADAANLDAVLICDPQTDIYNPNAIRASLGAIFTMPVVTSTSDLTISWLKFNKVKLFATALTGNQFYHEVSYRQPSAIIMGSEASGLSSRWMDEADHLVKIPMNGKIDSMNVSASAAVVIFEALRQRNFKQK
jgi:RNA methyltransferase, TrmH family